MKKLLATVSLFAAVGAMSLASCGNQVEPHNPREGAPIEVLVQTADHGWTGAVQKYALDKMAEVNAAGKHTVKVTACENPAEEIKKIEDLLADKNDMAGIVMLPIDASLETAITKIANELVPFVQFDRVVSNKTIDNAENRISNVKGNNYGIGVETAKAFIKKGIEKTDKILLMPGDQSSVPVSRTSGFKETLVKDKGWTMEEVNAMITETDYTGWSRATSKKLFSELADATQFDWVFTHDSEIALGILEVLNSADTDQGVKDHFKNGGVKGFASSSGLDEMYAVIEDDHTANYLGNVLSKDTYLFDVTYDPAMIKIAIQDFIDHLEGKTVKKDHIIDVTTVDKDNIDEHQGFGTGDYRKSAAK